MNMSRFVRVALAMCVTAVCICGIVACQGSSNNPSGGVAATVNGTEIPEQKVTDQIEQIREQSGLTEEDQWGQFLVENDMTPSSVREQIIDTMTEQELIMQGAKDLGIAVESSEIDEYIDNMKANYDSDEAWSKALEQAGFTEDGYRQTLEESLYEQKVGDYFEEKAEVTDEDYATQAQTYAAYYDGAKRSSHILFSVDDTTDEEAMEAARTQAADVRAQIEAGTLSFEDAVQQYSGDEGSKEDGGDVGWDQLNSFVTAYTDALAELDVDQISEPVDSEYGVHLIKVTEVYHAPEDATTITSLDMIPEAFQDSIKDMAVSVKANSDYTDWLDKLKEDGDIQVNDMPSGLPYDLDLTPYEEAAASESSSEDATATDAVTLDDTTTDVATTDGVTTDATATADGVTTTDATDVTTADGAATATDIEPTDVATTADEPTADAATVAEATPVEATEATEATSGTASESASESTAESAQ